MKPLLFFFAIASTLMACNNNSSNSSATNDTLNVKSTNSKEAKEERNKQIVKAGTEAFSQHDVEAVAKDFARDVLDYGDGSRPPVRGVDSFKYNTSQFFKAFPDMKGENLHYVADGDWVVVWGDWCATWKGVFAGQKATGKSFKVREADVFKFNNAGRISEHRGIQSGYEIACQIGMKTPNP
ncbi:MAG: ester cyclase [Chitinophagaceae bacterium]|nr:ester cyclase [Chitinophagaceae bacterium]